MKLEKKHFVNQFNEDIVSCRNAQAYERYETASYYRGCAQGMVTAMYWASIIDEDEFTKMNERIRRSITMEDDYYEKKN